MQIPKDISDRLPDIARSVAMPAIIGGAGGGALSAYMSSKSRPANETPGQRRRRILRNALVGTLLGGTAGATIPTGVNMLGGELLGPRTGVNPGASALGLGLSNAAPIGVGVAGGMHLSKLRGQEQGRALSQVFSQLKGKTIGKTVMENEDILRQALEFGGRDNVLKALALEDKGHSVSRLLKGHELLGEAGYKANILEQLLNRKAQGNFWGDFKPTKSIGAGIRSHLTEGSMLPGKLKQFGLGGLMAKAVGGEIGGHSTTPLAEAYLKYIRPSAKRMIGRGGWVGRGAMLGAGVYGAKQLQDVITGDN